MRTKQTYKQLDVVAVDQRHYQIDRKRNYQSEERAATQERWRIGLVSRVDTSLGAGQEHVYGRYVGADGKPTTENFDCYPDALQRVEFADVEHTVAVPPEWKKQLVDSAPRERKAIPGLDDGPPEHHPSYGRAIVARSSGDRKLFMSPFTHQYFVSLTIERAARHRGLSNDRTSGHAELLEVYFSESQWARLLSSISVGEGTPCTISAVGGDRMPLCPENDERAKFQDEVERAATKAADQLAVAIEKVEAMLAKPTVTKAERREVAEALRAAHMSLSSSLPFVIQQFTERRRTADHAARRQEGRGMNAVLDCQSQLKLGLVWYSALDFWRPMLLARAGRPLGGVYEIHASMAGPLGSVRLAFESSDSKWSTDHSTIQEALIAAEKDCAARDRGVVCMRDPYFVVEEWP